MAKFAGELLGFRPAIRYWGNTAAAALALGCGSTKADTAESKVVDTAAIAAGTVPALSAPMPRETSQIPPGPEERQVYLDADGDGAGAGEVKYIAASEEVPEGYVPWNGDCEPEDGSVHPGAPELVGDALDSNCDGVDAWPACAGETAACRCETLPDRLPEMTPTCEGSDLFFVEESECSRPRCGGGRRILVVGNKGSRAASAVRIVFEHEGAGGITTRTLPLGVLEAGQSSQAVLVPNNGWAVTVRLVSAESTAECNPDNNVTQYGSPSLLCL